MSTNLFPIDLKALLQEIEVLAIQDALLTAKHNRSKAARLLGMKRTTLVEKMRKYGMLVPRDVH